MLSRTLDYILGSLFSREIVSARNLEIKMHYNYICGFTNFYSYTNVPRESPVTSVYKYRKLYGCIGNGINVA